jgi:hypothetical protein
MTKIFLMTLVMLSLTSCGWLERGGAYLTGYAKTCIDGVLYYQFPSGVTVAYNSDGGIKSCK